jgi:hypothetical protein
MKRFGVIYLFLAALLISGSLRAGEVTALNKEMLNSYLLLHHTNLVEATTSIRGDTYRITIRLKKADRINEIRSIKVSLRSRSYEIPPSFFAEMSPISTTSLLFPLENDQIGFVLGFGDGEYSRRCLVRIDLGKRVVQTEVWNHLSGRIEKRSTWMPISHSQ